MAFPLQKTLLISVRYQLLTMFAKVLLLCAFVAAAQATALYGSSILAPGLLNSGILAPRLLNTVGVKGAPLLSAGIPTAYATKSVLAAPISYAAPAAITTQKTVIGTTGLLTGSPLAYSTGLVGAPLSYSTGLVGAPLSYSTGLVGAPLAYSNGLVGSHLGLRSGIVGLKGGRLAGPGVYWK